MQILLQDFNYQFVKFQPDPFYKGNKHSSKI